MVEMLVNEVGMLKKIDLSSILLPIEECLVLFVKHNPMWKKDSCLTFQFVVGCHNSACGQILKSIDQWSRYGFCNHQGSLKNEYIWANWSQGSFKSISFWS